MSFMVFLQILGPFEGLATDGTPMRLVRDMYANVRGDMIALHSLCFAVGPVALKIEIVGRLSANVTVANVVL